MNISAMFQLNPSIPVVTPDGKGEAIGWIDYGKEDDLIWIVFLQKNGECWLYPNPQIRACPNITFGRLVGVTTEKLSQTIRTRLKSPKRKKSSPLKKFPMLPRHSQNGHKTAAENQRSN